MKSVTVLVLLIGTLLITSCGTRSPHLFGYRSEIPKITVIVTNENYSDANVYLLRYGAGFAKIGFVTGNSGPTNFSTRESANTSIDVRIYIKFIGSNKKYVTEFFTISAGQTIELTIGSALWDTHFEIL